MNMTGNTILITGGSAGIGKALAIALHELGNTIIVTGRNSTALQAMEADYPGMVGMAFDIQNSHAIAEFANRISSQFPTLNILINNAGIMMAENMLADTIDLTAAEATISTNLLGPIRLSAALLPHLRRQSAATIMMVTSGLAFVPLAITPTYCATKAAIHSYAQSLRFQLRNTSVEVLELAPPAVATDLMPGHRDNPRCMPLDEFIRESIELAGSASAEILVDKVQMFREAESRGEYEKVFGMLNPASQ